MSLPRTMHLFGALVVGGASVAHLACSSSPTPAGGDGGIDGSPTDAAGQDSFAADGGGEAGGDGACPIIGMGSGQFASGSAQCDTCLGTHCCPQATTCFSANSDGGESDCTLLSKCVLSCLDDGGTTSTCDMPCVTKYPGGVTDGLQLNSCVMPSCSGQCPGL
jgi:hypothetical protein